jgi:hypothetical protein
MIPRTEARLALLVTFVLLTRAVDPTLAGCGPDVNCFAP